MTILKKSLIALVFVALAILFVLHFEPANRQDNIGGVEYSFTAATSTVTSVGTSTLVNISTWTALPIATNGSQGYIAICDNADSGISTSNPVYLGFGSTSTKPFGYRLASGGCHTMTLSSNNMFYGTIYAIASTASTTILEIAK